MSDIIVVALITFVATVGASGGFWAFITRKDVLKSATTQLLLGLAHDRIIFLGMGYIERGSITKDEYEDFHKYLYTPYSRFGGNGLADRIKLQVDQLPIKSDRPIVKIVKETHAEDRSGRN